VAIKRYYIVILITIIAIPSAYGAGQCVDKTCVDVFTSDNQLIITAQKGSKQSGAKPIAKKPVVKVIPKPKASTFLIPKLIAKPVVKRPVVKKPVAINPIIKKPVVKKAVAKVASASLSDKLIKMLPAGDIDFAPEQAALVNLPVYFWTQTPTRFTALVPILDVVVYVNLTPTFTWSFGDNSFFVTTTQGAPFPIGSITHTYKNSNDYQVNLKVTWRGTWSVNGVITPVSGNAITQSITRSLPVVKGPTKYIK
jgi:hypothetical protein